MKTLPFELSSLHSDVISAEPRLGTFLEYLTQILKEQLALYRSQALVRFQVPFRYKQHYCFHP